MENTKQYKLKEFIDEYIGVPYLRYGRDKNGIDCMGLVMEWMKREGVPLPEFSHAIDTDSSDFKEWFEIASKNYISVDDYNTGDLVFFIQKGKQHTGIIIDKKMFFHATEKYGVVISRISYFKDIYGYFRKT